MNDKMRNTLNSRYTLIRKNRVRNIYFMGKDSFWRYKVGNIEIWVGRRY